MENNIKILIIEDNCKIFESFYNTLKEQGFLIAESGATQNYYDALQKIARFSDSDYILLDMNLESSSQKTEETDGYKIIYILEKWIRDKIIITSGLADYYESDLKKIGIKHFPGKDTEKIVKCLRKTCNCSLNE